MSRERSKRPQRPKKSDELGPVATVNELTQKTPIGFEARRTQCRSAAAAVRMAPHVGPALREGHEAGAGRIRHFHVYPSALRILSVVCGALPNSASSAGSLERTRRGLAGRIFGSGDRTSEMKETGMTPSAKPRIRNGWRKPRSDNKIMSLPPAQREQIHQRFRQKNPSYREISELMQREFGVKTAISTLSTYYHTHYLEIFWPLSAEGQK